VLIHVYPRPVNLWAELSLLFRLCKGKAPTQPFPRSQKARTGEGMCLSLLLSVNLPTGGRAGVGGYSRYNPPMPREAWPRRLQPYLLLALFALPAIWPFFHPGLPRSNDHLIHFYRVVELDRLVRAGVFFPRWAPDLVHGYGYPVFNFVFPLAHGIVEVFHLLGPNLLVAYKATLILTLLCSAWFAYGLGREYFGEQAGLVTGLAYLYSPYLLYDIHIRGSLTESLMLALLPLALLHLRRAARGHRASVAWAGVAVAACVLAHHATMLQAMPFLVVYALFEAVMHLRDSRWRLIGNWKSGFRSLSREAVIRHAKRSFVILPFVIAFLLSAFFWLPAIAESRYIQVERGTLNAAMLYSNNFVSMSELTAFPRLPVDPDLLNPPVVRPLSLAALALIVVVALVRFPFRPRSSEIPRAQQAGPTPLLPHLLFFATLSLTATLLALPAARPLWDMLPLLRLTQFPWRILGPNSLFVALIAGSLLAESSTPDKWQFAIWNLEFGAWGFLLCLTPFALILAGLPFASPPFEAVPAAPTLADVARFETPPTFIGTTTTGEYLPIWVKQLPDTAPNRDRLIRGEPIDRFDAPGAQVTTDAASGLHDLFTVTSAQPVTFVYRTFYFPGWRAMLDGQSAPIRITYPEGLMAVDLPGGTHTLAFQFGTTPPRVVGTVLSLAGLLAVLVLLRPQGAGRETQSTDLPPATFHFPLSTFILAILLALARPLLYDAGYTPLLRRGLRPDGLFGVTHPLNQDLAGELTLLGWDANRETGGADGSFTVNLYWKANHALGVAYGFDVRLVDADGLTWSEPDPPRPRDWRFIPGTDFWPEDQYVMDSYVLTPLVGTPPGEYTLQVTVFARHNLQAIGIAQAGTLTINAPSRARRCTEDPSRWGPFFGDVISLKTLSFSPAQAAPGDDVPVSLCWHADHEPYPSFDWSIQLELIGEQGTVISQPRIIAPGYPTSRWKMGDVMRDQWRVRLPASLETGDYHWQISAGVTSWVGSLHVTAPPRTFAPPNVSQALNADLGPVTLFGINVSPPSASPGAPLTVTLVWKADELMDTSYHVFVHLLGPDGTLVTQSDGVPADWTRRTTGWLPGEFVTETRTLTLPPDAPPGEYTLWAGMYDPESQDRLTTSEFPDGRVPLGTVQVGP